MSGTARAALLGVVMATIWALSGVATPVAGQQSGSTCTGEADFSADPGLSNSPSSGTITTDGETGTIECGKDKGTFGFAGEYGTKDPDTCTSGGEGTASLSITIGKEQITDDVEFTYGGLQAGVFGGSWKGPRTSGDFEVTPTEGDCGTAPITKAHIDLTNVEIKK